jgi:hypothetical protein
VLLARALYRRPRILILDEGTSHLDVETERAVNAALSNLAITRLVAPTARRPSGRRGGSYPSKAAWRGRRAVCYINNRR